MSGGLQTLAGGFTYLESPRWHEGRIWASDLYDHKVVAIAGDGSVEHVATVGGQPSGLGWLPDGRLLIASMKDRRLLRLEGDGTLAVHADLAGLTRWHVNDLVVGADGTAYLGDFGFDIMGGAAIAPTGLVKVDVDGHAEVVAEDLFFPNGMVLSEDGATLLVAESMGARITAFDVDTDGGLADRRVWASFGDAPESDDLLAYLASGPVVPDGICLDAAGALWIADALAGRAVRVVEGGEIVAEVATAPLNAYACMLGGDDGCALHLCLAPSFAESERAGAFEAEIATVPVQSPRAGRP